MDLDRFKEVNDTLGHDSGDALLHELGERLLAACAAADTVARLGGDEFGFLLSDVDSPRRASSSRGSSGRSTTRSCCTRCRCTSRRASGSPSSPTTARRVDLLLQRADVAMYVAKRAGSGFAFYDVREGRPHDRRA